MRGQILWVDDDQDMCETVAAALGKRTFNVVWETQGTSAAQRLSSEDFDVIVADLRMPGIDGLELCRKVVEQRPDIPVIVVTAFGSLDTAVQAIRHGAYDFITKPFDLQALELALGRAIKHRTLREELVRLRSVVQHEDAPGGLLGDSTVMNRVHEVTTRVASSDVTVLITGESGTGKELVAREIHRQSCRAKSPFIAINCAAVPATLLESELFGHAKGAFTDARTPRDGLLVQAKSGTLFLDEIGDMPLDLQPKLLRVLQDRVVRPVGSDAEKVIDVRFIAATHKDLDEAVATNLFRQDLLYRLRVVEIEIPPLRARGNDILLLAQSFLQKAAERHGRPVAGLTAPTAEKLMAYSWPGNVRELQNCIERAVVLTLHDRLTVEDLPDCIRTQRATPVILDSMDPATLLPLREMERHYIEHVMRAVGGNKRLAAQILGVDRKTLYRHMVRDAPRNKFAD